jgi:hypothetical protein
MYKYKSVVLIHFLDLVLFFFVFGFSAGVRLDESPEAWGT